MGGHAGNVVAITLALLGVTLGLSGVTQLLSRLLVLSCGLWFSSERYMLSFRYLTVSGEKDGRGHKDGLAAQKVGF